MNTILSDAPGPDGRKRYYVWKPEDRSYMKMIFRHPDHLYPSGFRVLGSRFHPVGDFDRPDIMLPAESLRVYETRNGFRMFFTGRYNPDIDSMFDELDSLGGDFLYSKYGRRKRYFAMRVDPKRFPVPENWAVTRFLRQTGEPLPEWGKLISTHDEITRAHHKDSVLV